MKKILITGITKGIGLAIARKFYASGEFQILGCASTQSDIEELQHNYPEFILTTCDFRNTEEVLNYAQYLQHNHSDIEILINNAGKFTPGLLHRESDTNFDDLIQVNLKSVYLITKRIAQQMIFAQKGSIINICSTASNTPFLNAGTYCMSKFALYGYTKVLRLEMAPHNIRVIGILPGATYTDSWKESQLNPDRFIAPDSVAQIVWDAIQLPNNTVLEELIMRPMEGDLRDN